MEAVTFFVAAAVAVAGACGVVLLKNPVHAALSLVATLFGVAIHFINLEAYFLAAVQVIVYAGAIVILFLFVIMLLGVDRAEDIKTDPIIGQRQIAVLATVGLLILVTLIGVAFAGDVTGIPPTEAQQSTFDGGLAINGGSNNDSVPPQQNIKEIGRALFSTRYVFALEITALLLTIGVVGAVILTRRPKSTPDPLPDIEPPSIMRNIEDEHASVSKSDDIEAENPSSEESEVAGE
ncbi:MAG: NADH-quinone oxidoreductase subunit J [Actinomycetota bacterium]|nr:NADH-quinone oxidoreductase subunit J [Actinomycetota bacterium]